jgi:iron complex outermembrane receptor protein
MPPQTCQSLALLCATLLSSTAFAQATSQSAGASGGAAPATPTATAPTNELQEVVVTAQFRNQSVQQTPLAITAINADMLAERGQSSLTQLAADVPSVTLTPGEAAFGPSMVAAIRGIGQGDFNPALEPGVGIYVDDVYFGTLTGSLLDLLDLDRVEVLRGPQGTLSGMNSEGGAVKLFSKRPDAHPQTTFSALYGSRQHVEGRANTGFVLVPDRLFIRLAVVGNAQNGYVNRYDFGCANPSFTATATNGVTGTYSVAPGFVTARTGGTGCVLGQEGGVSYAAGRVSLRWLITDQVEATFIGDLSNDNSQAPATTLIHAGPLTPASAGVENITIPTTSGAQLPYDSTRVPAMIPSSRYANYATFCLPPVSNPALGINTPTYCAPDRTSLQSWGASANVLWTINDTMSLRSITAERAYSSTWSEDNDTSPWPLGLGNEYLTHHQFSQELRLNGTWGHLLDYTVGGFYFRELTTYASHQDLWYATATANVAAGLPVGFFNGFLDFLQNDPVVAHDRAGFLHTVWHLTPKLDFIAGGRYTSQDKDYTYTRVNPQGTTGGTATLVGSLNGFTGRYSATRWDYRANATYHWTDQLLTYGQVSTGFKGGGVNPRPFYVSQALHFNPETLTNYEVGLKSSWLDRKLTLNADVYFAQYRNIQLALLNCGFIPSIAALGQGTPCALPFNGGSAHEKGVELESQLRLGGFRFDMAGSYLNFRYVSLNANTGVTLGMVTPYTSRWQGNAGAQYTVSFGDRGALTARIDMNTRSGYFTNPVNAFTNHVGGYTTYNGRLTWDNSEGNWQVSLAALNFTDKFYYLNIFDLTAAGGGSVTGAPSPPVEVNVEIKHTL